MLSLISSNGRELLVLPNTNVADGASFATQHRPCVSVAYCGRSTYCSSHNSFSWDIMARFGPTHPNLPPAFFSDFTKMALDESKHLWASIHQTKPLLTQLPAHFLLPAFRRLLHPRRMAVCPSTPRYGNPHQLLQILYVPDLPSSTLYMKQEGLTLILGRLNGSGRQGIRRASKLWKLSTRMR